MLARCFFAILLTTAVKDGCARRAKGTDTKEGGPNPLQQLAQPLLNQVHFKCCLKEYANATPTFVIKDTPLSSTEDKACLYVTAVKKDLCGSFEECHQVCEDEFKLSPKYHALQIDDYGQTIIKQRELDLQHQNDFLDEAKEDKRRQEEKIEDLKAQIKLLEASLLEAQEQLLQKENTVESGEKFVEEASLALAAVEKTKDEMEATKDSLPSQEVPEACEGRTDCCCSIDKQAYKVKVDRFTSWSKCRGAAPYEKPVATYGCTNLMHCGICRKKICQDETFCP